GRLRRGSVPRRDLRGGRRIPFRAWFCPRGRLGAGSWRWSSPANGADREEKGGSDSLPYAGVSRIRFEGCNLSRHPRRHPQRCGVILGGRGQHSKWSTRPRSILGRQRLDAISRREVGQRVDADVGLDRLDAAVTENELANARVRPAEGGVGQGAVLVVGGAQRANLNGGGDGVGQRVPGWERVAVVFEAVGATSFDPGAAA